jgi:DNA-binding transcriptional ArsR family regulator
MGSVYFIRELVSGHVKIGWTSGRPQSRLRTLQVAHPHDLVLLGYIPGDKATERALHEKYAHLRLRGEWFRYDDDLRALVESQPVPGLAKYDRRPLRFDPTPMRMAIVAYLRDHPSRTAAMIASDVPGITRGTVYTTLNRLVDAGVLSSSIPAGRGLAPGSEEPRQYAVTERGGKIFEVWARATAEIARILA